MRSCFSAGSWRHRAHRTRVKIKSQLFPLHPRLIRAKRRGKYAVNKVVTLDGGRRCVVTVESTTEQDVITLRQTSKGKIIVTSRKLDDERERYEEEGGEAPD